ncbi:hypothetical protein Ndes2526B_g05579 [Nannochloris sp. 'desiccata']|nr:hypothetical protein KSW81_007436 [Chlorella desiccata (nom. nud.)]KAH7618665.1 putative serine/threonine-protein kinase abkB [Chlorella desiccata (nom. nud.)]
MLRTSLILGGTGQALASLASYAGKTISSHLSSTAQTTAAFSTTTDLLPASSALYWPLRIARFAGLGVALTAVALPVGTVAALVLTGRDEADAAEILSAVPRTLRVMWWSIWAAYNYKKLATSFSAASISEETYREELTAFHTRAAQALLRVCQTNGGVYVKAGQLAVSMQAIPVEFREGLEGLEDRVPFRSFYDINKVIVAELGRPASEIFAEFDERATAAASLAQVHRATTKDGMHVAVKVQYPGLESAVAADLTTMTAIASIAYFFFPSNDWRWLFAELRTKLNQELDFNLEAAHSTRLAACFADRKDVVVPLHVKELSTRRVLCMEWIEGAKISDVAALRRLGLSPRQVALTLLDASAEMMCVHGFVHGDMHPGNVFVRALPRSGNPLVRMLPWCRNARPQIVFIDHGLYFELEDNLRRLYCMLWCAFVLNDSATATATAVQLAGPRAGRALPEILRPRDWSKLAPEERRRLRQEVGVTGIRDMTRILNEAPRQLVDCLRAMALVRHTATRLGITIADRLRVNAVQALHGLQVEVEDRGKKGHHVEYVGVMRSRVKRWRLYLHIAAMRLVVWVALILGDQVEAIETPTPTGSGAVVAVPG